MKKVIVVGGSGFVGQHLIKILSAENAQVRVLCRNRRVFDYYNIETARNVTVCYDVDTANYALLEGHFKDTDIVVNLAGLISFYQRDRKKLISVNHQGTLNVLNACEKHKVAKLIHVSSTAAFGVSRNLVDETFEFNWAHHRRLVYSYSKSLSNEYIQSSPCDSTILFPPLILGPGDKNSTRKLLTAIKQHKMPFNTPGGNSYVDVRDLIQAILLVIEKPTQNETYITAAEHYSFKDMHAIIAEALDTHPPARTVPQFFQALSRLVVFSVEKAASNPPIAYENIYLAFKNRRHNSDKIRLMGWKPAYGLEQTIRDSWRWIEENGYE